MRCFSDKARSATVTGYAKGLAQDTQCHVRCGLVEDIGLRNSVSMLCRSQAMSHCLFTFSPGKSLEVGVLTSSNGRSNQSDISAATEVR